MHLRKRNSLLALCLLALSCQKIDQTVAPESNPDDAATEQNVRIVGTGEGTRERPFTVTDVQDQSLPADQAVWVVGYMVGTAYRSLSNATFTADATNQSNILLSADSLCSNAEDCIPVELSSAKAKADFSLPVNTIHHRKCLILRGTPSPYLNKKGLRKVSAGLWLDGFDVSSVAPEQWGTISL